MDAVPETFPNAAIGPGYRDPLCGAQTTADQVDGRWVRCPMAGGAMIALGCCLDLQAVARAMQFDLHPQRDLFDRVADETSREVIALRADCLEHQDDILTDQIVREPEPDARDRRLALRERVRALRGGAS